jgi:hypothetical protein
MKQITTTTTIRNAGERGFAMVIVIGYLFIVAAAGSAYIAFVHHCMAQAHAREQRQACLNLAEAGIDKAIAELRAKPSYEGEKNTPLGEGSFSVSVKPGDKAGTWLIRSNGRISDKQYVFARARVAAEITLAPSGAVSRLAWRELRGKE